LHTIQDKLKGVQIMKTIRQIAEEIGVSKQAVFYRIKKPPLSYALESLVSKENGISTVSLDGEKLIKQTFVKPKSTNKATSAYTENIKILHEQLRAKDKQITELTATIQMQIRKSNNYRKFYFNKKATKQKETAIPIKRLYKGQNTLN
jgi:hypothetical protein